MPFNNQTQPGVRVSAKRDNIQGAGRRDDWRPFAGRHCAEMVSECVERGCMSG